MSFTVDLDFLKKVLHLRHFFFLKKITEKKYTKSEITSSKHDIRHILNVCAHTHFSNIFADFCSLKQQIRVK